MRGGRRVGGEWVEVFIFLLPSMSCCSSLALFALEVKAVQQPLDTLASLGSSNHPFPLHPWPGCGNGTLCDSRLLEAAQSCA